MNLEEFFEKIVKDQHELMDNVASTVGALVAVRVLLARGLEFTDQDSEVAMQATKEALLLVVREETAVLKFRSQLSDWTEVTAR